VIRAFIKVIKHPALRALDALVELNQGIGSADSWKMRFFPILNRPLAILLNHTPRPTGNDIDTRDALGKEEVVSGMTPNGTVRRAIAEWRVELGEIFAVGGPIPPLVKETGAFGFYHRVRRAERWRWEREVAVEDERRGRRG
jgi:hypothetical protein